MNSIDFTITLRNNRTGEYLQLPVLPLDGKLTYGYGSTQTVSTSILGIGTVDFPSGEDLDSVSFSSFFPARYDGSYCTTSSLHTPGYYERTFLNWKAKKDSIQFIVPAAGINTPMFIRSYTPDHGLGAEGDIYYNVEFLEYKTIKPIKIKSGTTTVQTKKKTATSRPAAAKKSKPKTYTVKAGDYLTKIAKKYKIKNWRKDLYEPNRKPKGPLGPDPDDITPGMKLKLP